MIIATIAEWTYVPRGWAGAQHLRRRLFFSSLASCCQCGPAAFTSSSSRIRRTEDRLDPCCRAVNRRRAHLLSSSPFMPLGGLFGSYLTKNSRRYVASQAFTASYPRLSGNKTCGCPWAWLLRLCRQVRRILGLPSAVLPRPHSVPADM